MKDRHVHNKALFRSSKEADQTAAAVELLVTRYDKQINKSNRDKSGVSYFISPKNHIGGLFQI